MARGRQYKGKLRGVFERPEGSGIYWARWRDYRGQIHRKQIGNRADAHRYYIARMEEKRKGTTLPRDIRSGGVLFGELIDDCILDYRHSVKNRDWAAVKGKMEANVRPSLGHRPAAAISPREIREWLDVTQRAQGWSDATRNRYKAFLSRTFRVAIVNGKAATNPARDVQRLAEDNIRDRVLSDDEEASLRKWMAENNEAHHIAELDLALHTGMRQGEMYNLTWRDVDMRNRRIVLKQKATKNRTARTVELNAIAFAAMQEFQSRGPSHGNAPVIISPLGTRIVNPRSWFERACEGAEIQGLTWHGLRHTGASRLAELGEGILELQGFLGHKGMEMSARYVHLGTEAKRRTADLLAARAHMTSQTPEKKSTKRALVQKPPSPELAVNHVM